MTAAVAPRIEVRAYGPQQDFIMCPIEDVFYGGARGGMKTYGCVLDFVAHAEAYGKDARGIIFRRTYDELEEVERICQELLSKRWRFRAQKRTWESPKGATLKLRYLKRDEDAQHYQGHQYTRIYGDEAGNFANPRPFDLMYGALRSPQGVPCGRRLTGNPGGPGHGWLKARYISPSQPWVPFKYQPQPDEMPHLWVEAVFIPSTLDDNPFLMRNDPKYEQRLAMVGGPELFRAWRWGDWDITAGAALEIVPKVHIVKPFKVPDHWEMFAGFDWGYAHPWSFSIYTVNEDGRVFCVDTLRGRRLRDPEIVKDIKNRYPNWRRLDHVVAGRDCWNAKPESKDDTPNTAEIFQDAGFIMDKANTDRIPGLKNFREYLAFKGRADDGSDDDPRFCWMDTKGNRRAIDAIQAVVTDPDNPEDALKIDYSEGGAIGDDDYDQTRYALASRPIVSVGTWKDQTVDAFSREVLEHEAKEQRRSKRYRPPSRVIPDAVT